MPVELGQVDGFAAMPGHGRGPTTGGLGGATAIVRTAAELKDAAGAAVPLTVQVRGLIDITGSVHVGSDKTITGLDRTSGLLGGGLVVDHQHNVIIRNLRVGYPVGVTAIRVRRGHHVWIDHNELWSDRAHPKKYYDGLIDITRASDFVTVSWNVLRDHFLASLIGASDEHATEDTGRLAVTFHHNSWYDCRSRLPAVRFGTAHIFNNLYVNAHTGINSRMGAQTLVENNVFRDVAVPITTSRYSTEPGFANIRGNDFGGGSPELTQIGDFLAPPYPYTPDPAAEVPAIVAAGAGVIT